jgi:sporulation protein YlmC with PRC-barrel domain
MKATFGRYFNKGVKALDARHIGFVVRETDDEIVVFGDGKIRYDIPLSEIKTTGKNLLIELKLQVIERKYKVDRDIPLPTGRLTTPWTLSHNIDLATYEGKYPNSLFNKGVRARNEDHVGHVMKDTDDKIVVFGHGDNRFDIPKSRILAVGKNVILDMNFPEIFDHKVDRNAPLPTGEPVEILSNEELV